MRFNLSIFLTIADIVTSFTSLISGADLSPNQPQRRGIDLASDIDNYTMQHGLAI
jgi:hypothetical protein